MRMATLVIFLLTFVAMPDAVAGRNVSHVERLSHRSECGNVAVWAGGETSPRRREDLRNHRDFS